ncbi:uncharacterized protein LOC128917627 [Rissa tridactyla]|uniref:uncharacterized protein LOC128917627 n=1 Tax=Rissa tridactyla TaxID=75485 RepID=UPI0023BA64AB|nr:uncharacterized protein LOC128917627 [Rissa tridactyla]
MPAKAGVLSLLIGNCVPAQPGKRELLCNTVWPLPFSPCCSFIPFSFLISLLRLSPFFTIPSSFLAPISHYLLFPRVHSRLIPAVGEGFWPTAPAKNPLSHSGAATQCLGFLCEYRRYAWDYHAAEPETPTGHKGTKKRNSIYLIQQLQGAITNYLNLLSPGAGLLKSSRGIHHLMPRSDGVPMDQDVVVMLPFRGCISFFFNWRIYFLGLGLLPWRCTRDLRRTAYYSSRCAEH